MEDLVKEMGFDSLQEFNKLNVSVDLTDPIKLQNYLKWKEEDGSKNGLLKLID